MLESPRASAGRSGTEACGALATDARRQSGVSTELEDQQLVLSEVCHDLANRFHRSYYFLELLNDALDGCSVGAIAWHPDGQFLAVGGIDMLVSQGRAQLRLCHHAVEPFPEVGIAGQTALECDIPIGHRPREANLAVIAAALANALNLHRHIQAITLGEGRIAHPRRHAAEALRHPIGRCRSIQPRPSVCVKSNCCWG